MNRRPPAGRMRLNVMAAESDGDVTVARKKERAKSTTQIGGVQGSAKRWALGCVNPTSWLPLAMGASSRNLGTTF